MKYFHISTFLTIITIILSLIWFSMLSNPIMISKSELQSDLLAPSLSPINSRLSSVSTRVPTQFTILPKTNLTVSQYISSRNEETIDLQLNLLNASHWFASIDYKNTSSFDTPFDSVISRDSMNHFYIAKDYYNWLWDVDHSDIFDFWIDTTNFVDDYQFFYPGSGNYSVIVQNLENITIDGIGTFETWNLTVDFPSEFPNFAYYEKNTGLCLSSYFYLINDIWFNLTKLEMASPSDGYNGPMLRSTSPSNGSSLASGSIISVDFTSPYGLAGIEYSWDGQTNLTTTESLETVIPNSDGLHNLTIIAFDNIGYYSSFLLVYHTDNTLAGIVLRSPRNNSQVQGISHIALTILSSNGTLFYNWDNDTVNDSMPVIADSVAISIPDPSTEVSHTLIVYVKNIDNAWTLAKYFFVVDNTAPSIIVSQFANNSILKGVFSITLNASEDVNLTYSLNGAEIESFLMNENQNHSLLVNELANGTYHMHLEIYDEAGNINSLLLTFFIHTSDFDWNWELSPEETHSMDLYDENRTYWFTSSAVSKSNQFYNFSILADNSNPNLPSNFVLGVSFQCEVPADIIFLTLAYPLSEQLSNSSDTFPVYQWVVWENQEWVELETIYDQVSHSWITTNLGYSQYFALLDSGEITQLKSVIVGGGSIPAFELPTILFSVCMIVLIKKVKK